MAVGTAETLNLAGFSYALKTVYDTGKVMSTVAQNNVAYARMPKNMKFPGENFAYSVLYGAGARSYSFTKAKTNKRTTKGKKFVLTRSHDYSLGSIDTETILSSEGSEGALLSAMKTQADGSLLKLKRSLGMRTYGNGSGKIGTIATPGADTTMALANADDITNFEVGDCIVFAADEASALRDSGEALEITAINRDVGNFTVSANETTIASIAAADCVFIEGDYASASDRNLVVGFDGWNPATAPTGGDSHFSVNRSTDTARLAGLRYTSTTDPGLSTEEVIQLLASRIQRGGFSANTCYMGTDRMRNFITALGSKVQYGKDTVSLKNGAGKVVAEVGFDSIRVHAGGSVIECFADMNCPESALYVQTLDTWEFKSLGECPRWLTKNHVEDSADTVEFRLAYWGNIRCKAPGANARYDF